MDLHGILVLSDDKFLQLLEGPSKFVNELFCKMTDDSRHHQIELVSFESVV